MSSFATSHWDRDSVGRALRRYAELCEIYRAAFVASSWPLEVKYSTGPRSWPARFSVLSSKWDLDRAVAHMTPFHQAVFHLRYRLGCSQERIGRILGCSRYWVWEILEQMPGLILQALTAESPSERIDHDHSGPRLRQRGALEIPARRLPPRIGLPEREAYRTTGRPARDAQRPGAAAAERVGGLAGERAVGADRARMPAGVVGGEPRRL